MHQTVSIQSCFVFGPSNQKPKRFQQFTDNMSNGHNVLTIEKRNDQSRQFIGSIALFMSF